jgi:hypothetical protein
MTPGQSIRQAIVELYGPCPTDDFLQANAWAEGIDWEDVKATVEADHPEFEWTHHDPKNSEVAEAMILDVRHGMLQEAGHGPSE